MSMVFRGIAGTLTLIVGLLSMVACAPATAPTPVAKPSEVATIAAKPAASTDWKTEWDKVVAAARNEGKVAVVVPPGDMWHDELVTKFEAAYPGIRVDYVAGTTPELAPRLLLEREAGKSLWDVGVGGGVPGLDAFIKPNYLAPLRPALLLPDVLDNGKWYEGFDSGFVDADRQYIYRFSAFLAFFAMVNRDVAPQTELRTIDDLVDPKWKGQIATRPPRLAGALRMALANQVVQLGEEKGRAWVQRFVSSDLVLIEDSRMLLENLIRGRYAVGIGIPAADTDMFEREGLLTRVEVLQPDDPRGAAIVSGWGTTALFKDPPHPNAQKVFVNWLLTKEGQEGVTRAGYPTARLDVQTPPKTTPKPGLGYVRIDDQKYQPLMDWANEIASQNIK